MQTAGPTRVVSGIAEMPDFGAMKLARYFHERGKEFQPLPQFAAIDRCAGDALVVRNDPPDLVIPAIGPQDPADLPDVVSSPAMRATAEIMPPVQWKGDDVVRIGVHGRN